MTQAKQGDKVSVHYTGTLKDGTPFDSSEGREPLEFTIGEKEVIPGFEEAIVGMSPGDTRNVTIAAEEGYGPHMDEMVVVVDRRQFPANIDPKVGQQLQVHQEDGGAIVVTVTEVSEEDVTLDGNHPLAGQDLTFDITLVAIA